MNSEFKDGKDLLNDEEGNGDLEYQQKRQNIYQMISGMKADDLGKLQIQFALTIKKDPNLMKIYMNEGLENPELKEIFEKFCIHTLLDSK